MVVLDSRLFKPVVHGLDTCSTCTVETGIGFIGVGYFGPINGL